MLKKYNVKASFFVVARFAEENPKIIDRMKAESHTIGLHSLEHKNALWQTPCYTRYDISESVKSMDNLGVKVKFFRPPWGHLNIETILSTRQYGLRTVLWSVMAEDWSGNTTHQVIADKILRRTKSGDVICLHDGRGKMKRQVELLLHWNRFYLSGFQRVTTLLQWMNYMNNKFYVKSILKNGGLFLLLIVLAFYLLFRGNNIADLIRTISQVNPFYIIVAIGCMCLFICCEAVNIEQSLKMFGYKVKFYLFVLISGIGVVVAQLISSRLSDSSKNKVM